MAPRTEPQVALGQAIRQTRIAHDLSQEEVANLADTHPTWISHVESGRNPAWGTVRRIASALGVEVSEIARLAEQIEAEGSPATRSKQSPGRRTP